MTPVKRMSSGPLPNSHFKVCQLKTPGSFSLLQGMLSSCLLSKAPPLLLTTKPFLEEGLGWTDVQARLWFWSLKELRCDGHQPNKHSPPAFFPCSPSKHDSLLKILKQVPLLPPHSPVHHILGRNWGITDHDNSRNKLEAVNQPRIQDTLQPFSFTPPCGPGGTSAKHYPQLVVNEKTKQNKNMLCHFRKGLYLEPVKCLFGLYASYLFTTFHESWAFPFQP